MKPTLVLYDDDQGSWGPMTDLRPVFDLRTGALTTRQRSQRTLSNQVAAILVPQRHQAIMQAREPELMVNQLPQQVSDLLLVNGRCASPQALSQIANLPAGSVLLQDDGQRLAVRIGADRRDAFAAAPHQADVEGLQVVRFAGRGLLERPWHLLEDLEATLRHDLETAFDLPARRNVTNVVIRGEYPIRISPDAQVQPMVVLDATQGPIVIDHTATISPFVILTGPCYVGAHTLVNPHTHLRPGTSIGPYCMVGGEVSLSVMQAYSNKSHAGYLGNSYIGQWVNLGAETTASNLKNTYSPIRMQLDASQPAEDTGLIKLGSIVGDYVRTAIGTRFTTGSCVGTAAMVAVSSFAPKLVERFAFLTDMKSAAADLDKVLATAGQMMLRRHVEMSDAEVQRLRDLAAGVRP